MGPWVRSFMCSSAPGALSHRAQTYAIGATRASRVAHALRRPLPARRSCAARDRPGSRRRCAGVPRCTLAVSHPIIHSRRLSSRPRGRFASSMRLQSGARRRMSQSPCTATQGSGHPDRATQERARSAVPAARADCAPTPMPRARAAWPRGRPCRPSSWRGPPDARARGCRGRRAGARSASPDRARAAPPRAAAAAPGARGRGRVRSARIFSQ